MSNRETTTAPKVKNPFKGADSYSEYDKQNFYGRDQERNEMIRLIAQNTLTLLYSRSGVGKSSLLKAAVMPRLKELKTYFPVCIRVSENMLSQEKKIPDFSTAVIKLIREAAAESNVSIESSALVDDSSLTEFIYLSTFTRKESGNNDLNSNGTSASKKNDVVIEVIPILILDQFEEIFSLNFDKGILEKFLNDLADLIESRIPLSLKTKLHKTNSEAENDKLISLKNRLENTNKWYRVVFSFREEYLPKFQSLKSKIPLVFYTKGKLYLETFSVEKATEVIDQIASESIPLEKNITENLAITISKKDSESVSLKQDVQPFMLSLVCKNIYPQLVEGSKDESTIRDVLNQDESLVEKVVSSYFKNVFSSVSWQTKRFVEEKLITDDDKRTMKAFNDIKSELIRKDVTELWTNPELRYLNEVEYFGAPHVEILHDRLVKPLLKSRDRRRFWEKLTLVAAVFALVVAGIYLLNGYLLDAKTKREASTSFFHKLNPKILQALLKDSLNSPVDILENVIAYRDDLKDFPQFKKTAGVFSDLDDSIVNAFGSLYLFDRYKLDQQKYLSPNGIFRLKDTLNKPDTVYTEIEYLTDSGYSRYGYINIQSVKTINAIKTAGTREDTLTFSPTSSVKASRRISFLSDSIVQTRVGEATYFYNINKRTTKNRVVEVAKVDKGYSFIQSGDKANILELRRNPGAAKSDTIIVHQFASGEASVQLVSREFAKLIFPYYFLEYSQKGRGSQYASPVYDQLSRYDKLPQPVVYSKGAYYLNNKFYFFQSKETDASLAADYYGRRKYSYDLFVFPSTQKKVTLIKDSESPWDIGFSNPYFIASSLKKFVVFELKNDGISIIKEDSTNFFLLKTLLINHGQKVLKMGRYGGRIEMYDVQSGKNTDLQKKYDTLIRKPDSLKAFNYNAFISEDQSKLLLLYYDYSGSKTQYYTELIDLNTMRVKSVLKIGEMTSGINFKRAGAAMLVPSGLTYSDQPITEWYYNYTPGYRYSELDSFYRYTITKRHKH